MFVGLGDLKKNPLIFFYLFFSDTRVALDDNTADTADVLGVSAVIIADLKHPRHKDYTFKWDAALSVSILRCFQSLELGLFLNNPFYFRLRVKEIPECDCSTRTAGYAASDTTVVFHYLPSVILRRCRNP